MASPLENIFIRARSLFIRFYFITMRKLIFSLIGVISVGALSMSSSAQISKVIDILRPSGATGAFGSQTVVLANGNIVVGDGGYIHNGETGGGIFLYDGRTGQLISLLRGSQYGDNLGSGGIFGLPNGGFVVCSPLWRNGTLAGAGAATYCDGTTGCSGEVSAENSIVGTRLNEGVGNRATVLTNGNYIIHSFNWNFTRGASTFRTPEMGTSGIITAENSAVGGTTNDRIGDITQLPNGNYLLHSGSWNQNRGAVRHCNGVSGCFGAVSSANSLVGVNASDSVGGAIGRIRVLANGNYIVRGQHGTLGSVTFGNGITGVSGPVTSANSLVGRAPNDEIGTSFSGTTIETLTNGNYVVVSSRWRDSGGIRVGSSTFGNGMTGTTGVVTEANSVIGVAADDFSSARVKPLVNGNYVLEIGSFSLPGPNGVSTWVDGTSGLVGTISSANSLIGAGENVVPLLNGNYLVLGSSLGGAATFCPGTQGCQGDVTSANSLIGLGTQREAYALANGNYVVVSQSWNSSRGAATFGNGAIGVIGEISAENSLIGNVSQESVGQGGVKVLANGNYVVSTPKWNGDRRALTWGSGMSGVTGTVSVANSLVGSTPNQGPGGIALPNGNYLAVSSNWDNDRGIVVWVDGTKGLTGVLSESQGMAGNESGDFFGGDGIRFFPDFYAILSRQWDNGPNENVGAITFARYDAPLSGTVTVENSVVGYTTFTLTGPTILYDSVNEQVVVARSHGLSLFRFRESRTPYDYDGDGRTDFSVFRPSTVAWYLQRTTAGFQGLQFGADGDRLTPADYDGDGKTDVSVYRPSSGTWYIFNSATNTVTYPVFGVAEDLPAPGDYDGDGKADLTVFRPSQGTWYRQNSSNGSFFGMQFGATGDVPTVGDFDGDGKNDLGIWRPSVGDWYNIRSSNGSVFGERFGQTGDKIAPADYDGDGKTDIAIYRPSTGLWVVRNSATATYSYHVFGAPADIPIAGDYDGDGKADIGVWRPSDGTWYIKRSDNGQFIVFPWGQNGDRPTPAAYGN